MKPRLLLSLLVCSLALAGCYRQTEEPFQQVDSAEVAEAATAVVADGEVGDDAAADAEAEATRQPYITPETAPSQLEQPTIVLPISGTAADTTAPLATLAPFVRPSPTRTFEEQLDPADECVYQVQAGNVLFRLALAWGTTYQTIMEVNQLDSENLSIGQLLLIPDCEPSAPEATVADESAAAEASTPGPVISEEDSGADAEPTEPPEYHVVSAGETIESISLRYRVDVNELIALNELANPNQLSVGQELKLPQQP